MAVDNNSNKSSNYKSKKSSNYKSTKSIIYVSRKKDPLTPAEAKLKKRSDYNKAVAVNSAYRFNKLNTYGNFISLFIGILILACLIRVMNGSSNLPTFSSFLSILSNAPTIQIPFLSSVITELGDWGILNVIRDFLQILISIFDIAIFLINGLINLMSYVVYFMRWIFIG